MDRICGNSLCRHTLWIINLILKGITMRKLQLTALLLLLPSISFAQNVNFTPSDDSPYTAVCMAAIESEAAVKAKMEEHSLSRSDITELSCNGMSLDRFAAKYRNSENHEPIRVFAFTEATNSAETTLCIAAATSNDEYLRLKNELFKNNRTADVASIVCNRLPLQTFARRYGNSDFKI